MTYKADLDFANSPAVRTKLAVWYRSKWKDISDIIPMTDLTSQLLGRDILLLKSDGSYEMIEEKIRREKYAPQVAQGLLIEFYKHSGQPGWIHKQSACQWLVYGCETGDFKRIPWEPLKKAWDRHGNIWRKTYGVLWTDDYKTANVAVPWDIIKAAIQEFMPFWEKKSEMVSEKT